MRRAGRWLAFIVIGGIAVLGLGAATLRVSPFGPDPTLPPGAVALSIETQPVQIIPTLGCPGALLSPVRVATAGDALVAISTETGEPVPVAWPGGWVAWRIDGAAVLVDHGGTIVAREGDILDRLGGAASDDGRFRVCRIGS